MAGTMVMVMPITPFHAHHFDTLEQQFDSGKLGTCCSRDGSLFFSGLFVAYIVYRAIHPEIFEWGTSS